MMPQSKTKACACRRTSAVKTYIASTHQRQQSLRALHRHDLSKRQIGRPLPHHQKQSREPEYRSRTTPSRMIMLTIINHNAIRINSAMCRNRDVVSAGCSAKPHVRTVHLGSPPILLGACLREGPSQSPSSVEPKALMGNCSCLPARREARKIKPRRNRNEASLNRGIVFIFLSTCQSFTIQLRFSRK